MKSLVVYYSKTGSSRFLAEKIASALQSDLEPIRPIVNWPFMLMMGLHFGHKKMKYDVKNYDFVIVCGPVWIGKLIAPLKHFITKNQKKMNRFALAVSCGSTDANKDDKFGYNTVFKAVQKQWTQCVLCEAFPIALLLPPDRLNDDQAFMNTHLNDSTFNDKMKRRLDDFIGKVKLQLTV